MIKIHIRKRTKMVFYVLILAVFAAAGRFIEKYDTPDFIVETVTSDENINYHSDAVHVIDGKININSADSNELALISGVGASLAEKIIAYREENGPFMRIEDIMAVKGISEKKFETMRDIICIEERVME